MLKKFSSGICFYLCFIFLIFVSVNSGHASGVRVGSMGAGALVPDEETDLNYNPAFISYIEGQRIFSGIDFSYNNSETTEKPSESSKDSTERQRRLISPNLEYVSGISDIFKFAIKYNPLFSKTTNESENNWDVRVSNNKSSTKDESKANNFADIRLLAGVSLAPGVKIGYSISYSNCKNEYKYKDTIESTNYVYKNKSETDYKNYYQNLGLIFDGVTGNKYAFTVGQTGFKSRYKGSWDNYESRFLEQIKTSAIGIDAGFIPEIRFGENLILRSSLSCAYLWDKPKYSYAPSYSGSQIYNLEESSISDEIGAGLNYRYDSGTLFSFTVQTDGYVSKDSHKEAYDIDSLYYSKTNYKTISRNVFAGIGVEKEIIPQLLAIRCKILPFGFQYVKDTKEIKDQDGVKTESIENKTSRILGPVYSYSLGIGYQPYENVMVDIDFSQISSMHSKATYTEKSYPGKESTEEVTDNYGVNFAVTCKF